ncbi:hypothetical protein AAY473_006026 [Plecturocebus cupreus]
MKQPTSVPAPQQRDGTSGLGHLVGAPVDAGMAIQCLSGAEHLGKKWSDMTSTVLKRKLGSPDDTDTLTAPQLGISQMKEPEGWPRACRGGPSVGARTGTGGGSGDFGTSLSSSFVDFLSSSGSSSSSSNSSSSSLV